MRASPSSLGFTLLEAAFVLAVTAVIVAVAIPSYSSYQQRQELRQAGDALAQDLRNARELSATSSQGIFISFRPGGGKWCWGLSYGLPCDCSANAAACTIGRGDSSAYPDVSMTEALDIEIAAKLAQVTRAGGASFKNRHGENLRVQMSLAGRAAVCGPDSPGSKPC